MPPKMLSANARPFVPGVSWEQKQPREIAPVTALARTKRNKPRPRMLVGLFTHGYKKYCNRFEATIYPMMAICQLYRDALDLIFEYLIPDQDEFAQLALVQSMDGDEEFDEYQIEYLDCPPMLHLIHPQRFGMHLGDEEPYSTDDIIEPEELDDLHTLARKVYDDVYDDLPQEELPEVFADLLEYRFANLMAKPLLTCGYVS